MLTLYWNKLIIPYWPALLSAILFFIIASLAGLAAPLIIKVLIDNALSRNNLSFLHLITSGIVALYLVRGLFFYFYNVVMARVGNNLITDLRQTMFNNLQKMDYGQIAVTPAGDLISLFTNDVLLIEQAVSQGVPDLLVEALSLLAIIIIMIYFDWELALVAFVTLPFIIIAIGFFNKKIAGLGVLVEQTLARVTNTLHQFMLSVRVVQSYVREDYEYRKFSQEVNQAADDILKMQRLNALLIPLVEFLAAIGITVIIWYGGREVIDGDLTIGGMLAFLIYIINVPTPVRKISEAITKLKLGAVAWQRTKWLEKVEQNIKDGEIEVSRAKGNIELRDVCFSYNGSHTGILKNISFQARPGQLVAIVGPSGAGKSSFANLLLRFYDPSAGAIYLDGIDLRQFKISTLRRQIGFVQQEPILFNSTILENVRYGRPEATMAEVISAAKMANAHDFIINFSQGYDSPVKELGGNLSGGQRQRIALARTIITNPVILLLDEPTASLDAEAEKQVMAAIRRAAVGRTTFLITHNLAALLPGDKIIYLENGRIAKQLSGKID